jgi:hypothetical protein
VQFINCPNLTSLAGLPSSVQIVHCEHCPALTDALHLPPLTWSCSFRSCVNLRNIRGLPHGLVDIIVNECPALVSVAGLPSTVRHVEFTQCGGLTSVEGLPSNVHASFNYCTRIVSVSGLPPSMKEARFLACTRLRRRPVRKHLVYGRGDTCPGQDVACIYAATVLDALRDNCRVGDGVARCILQLATAGFRSPSSMWTRNRVLEYVK